MSERKNIDRLFQEKFKDFEVNPSEEIWGNIEAQLDKKKKRRIIPFWWKLSGVAAVFLLGFFISKSIYNGEVKKENSVVNETNFNKTKEGNVKQLNKNTGIKTENPAATENNSNKTKQTNTEDPTKKELKNNGLTTEAVVTNSNEVKSNSVLEKNKSKKTIYSSKSSVSEIKNSNDRSLKNKSNLEENKTTITQSVFEKSKNQVVQNTNENKQAVAEKEIAQTKIVIENKTSFDTKNINLDGLKEDINSKIVIQKTVKKENDTVPKNSVVSNVLEELLNEKESKVKQESKRNRWQLSSNVAPVFLGSISNGSPIDSTLSKNSKSFNTNVGFGIGVSYVVNKKLSVRTGLNKVNMSYDTNDILFFTGIQAKTMRNVTPTASSSMIQIQSSTPNNTSNLPSENELLSFENTFVQKNSGYLNQEIGYVEMPMELTYSLLDKKFGIKIIGGFSTLFLQDNSITIISDGRDTLLGEANNLNDIHFSTNLGLGIKYGFMKDFEFNIEPTFKYQLNTFSTNDGSFRPYIFGIYSGVSYKF
jgi:hypothetical protein